MTLKVSGKLLDLATPKVMGIVNVTPDSFYEGSRTQCEDSICRRVSDMKAAGVDILDVGGYSSRPGADDVTPEQEYARLSTGLSVIRKEWPDAIISIDTFRADVARRCVEDWGVNIINDIGGGTLDNDMFETIADMKVGYVLMHMRGTPSTMNSLTNYNDVTADVITDLSFKASALRRLGVCDIIIDPGFGFAKTLVQNYQLLKDLEEFKKMGYPVLVGLSRKSMIYRKLNITPEESLAGTIALNAVALMKGADIIRVHDYVEAIQTVKLLDFNRSHKQM